MSREAYQRAKELFFAARDLSAADRSEYLDRECADAPEIRRTVEGMLEVVRDEPGFLAPSPFAVGSVSDLQRTRIRRLVEHSNAGGRLIVEGEVARGGMGAILRVRDDVLRRTLAMKVIHGQKGASSTGEVPGVSREIVDRFLDEAQVTGRLEHPGVVPVHELGVDSEGRLYFTMPLVRGRTFAELIDLVHAGDPRTSQARALGILQKVCETMAYAHDSGVVHRDLKPSNVMVGDYGEVYVMDWGLARKRERTSARDAGPDEADPQRTRLVDEDSGHVTRSGAVLGTPSFMSPEQARGEVDRVDAPSDIYAIGSMLYHLLVGSAPYARTAGETGSQDVLADLRRGPPPPIASLVRKTPPELIAIAERAMAREPEDRYGSAAELARDLQAYLEGRVVRAHRTGAWIELRKWVGRNRLVAAVASIALAAVLLGSMGMAAAERQSAALSRSFLVFYLEDEERELWPAVPGKIAAMDQWLADAEGVLPLIDTAIAELAGDEAVLAERRQAMREAVERIRVLAESVRERRDFARALAAASITDPAAQAAWREASLAIDASPIYQRAGRFRLEPQIGLLPLGEDPATGLWEFWHLPSGERPAPNPAWNPEWRERGAAGGPNRWELQELTGDGAPADKAHPPEAGTGLVLVLVPPAADILFGGQGYDPGSPNFEPRYRQDRPKVTSAEEMVPILRPYAIDVAPYFISKYEMTQGQWLRCFGSNISVVTPSHPRRPTAITWTHPVNYLDGELADELLGRLGLRLPTEEEWEYAARGDTTSTWWCGPAAVISPATEDAPEAWGYDSESDCLHGAANLWGGRVAIQFIESDQGPEASIPLPHGDGFPATSPVGSFRANPFGLHDIYGNVQESCIPRASSLEDPSVAVEPYPLTIYRGGSFMSPATTATSGYGYSRPLVERREEVGVRPVRDLDAPAGEQ